jgi:hypothetical protein
MYEPAPVQNWRLTRHLKVHATFEKGLQTGQERITTEVGEVELKERHTN